ncbi:MAG: DUF4236 domain-containing protein [Proteobacteria bacterium]|nr:MAG: DUF4236 domain-containing protein [Pseudomonadota bacterium]
MGFSLRKSFKAGPIRINLSRKGVGASIGVKGMRIGKSPGRKARATFSIPGTGLSYGTSFSSRRKRASSGGGLGALIVLGGLFLMGACGSLSSRSSRAAAPVAQVAMRERPSAPRVATQQKDVAAAPAKVAPQAAHHPRKSR